MADQLPALRTLRSHLAPAFGGSSSSGPPTPFGPGEVPTHGRAARTGFPEREGHPELDFPDLWT